MRLLLAALAAPAAAFPLVLESFGGADSVHELETRETNCGPTPCSTFNAKQQFVDISSKTGHQFIAPTASDRRGPCPGLNAAANHGYLPRDGIMTTGQTVVGLAQAFGMGADLAAGLAVLGVVLEGDPIAGTWSIGGPYPGALGYPGGEEPQGISFSHNNYEGDSSVTRQDAYLNNGDAHSMVLSRFEALYNTGNTFTLESLRNIYKQNQQYSVANNPYYFNAQFSGLLVVPAAHNFIINFFSNHSAEQPNGYLDRHNIKAFFGVTGEPGSFATKQGHERIPENWYRRPLSDPYDLTRALADVQMGYITQPGTFKLGGNLNGKNSFTGVDLADLTGGVYNSKNIFEGNNLGCFVLQAQQEDFPDTLKGLEAAAAPLLKKFFAPLLSKLECPKLEKYNQGLFNKFPGYKYHPKGS